MSIERKVCEAAQLKIATKSNDPADPGRLMGYASTFHNWDRVGERPTPDAFDRSLKEFLRDGFIALDHDWTKRIATLDIAAPNDYGLWIEADFHSTPDAQQERVKTMERIDRGKTVSLSIGYEVLDDEITPEGRLLKDIRLYEVSLVSVPANPLALLAGAKSGGLVDGSLLSYSDELVAVVDAVENAVKRTQARAELRAKEGRVLSSANRERLTTLMTELEKLLADAEPRPAQDAIANTEEVRKELARFLMWEASQHGVTI